MKKLLQKRVFGGRVPLVAVIVFVLAVAFWLYKRKKSAATSNNPASDPNAGTGAVGYSSPDMFPYAGQGLYSPPSVEGSPNPQTAPSPTLTAHQMHVAHEQHLTHVGNTPHRNTRTLDAHQLHQAHLAHLAHIGK